MAILALTHQKDWKPLRHNNGTKTNVFSSILHLNVISVLESYVVILLELNSEVKEGRRIKKHSNIQFKFTPNKANNFRNKHKHLQKVLERETWPLA